MCISQFLDFLKTVNFRSEIPERKPILAFQTGPRSFVSDFLLFVFMFSISSHWLNVQNLCKSKLNISDFLANTEKQSYSADFTL